MATASVLGLQGSTTGNASTYLPNNETVIALGKHFAGYGGAEGGLNGGPLIAGERVVRDVYLKPWRFFAKAGGRGAMPSHQTVLDVPCHGNPDTTMHPFNLVQPTTISSTQSFVTSWASDLVSQFLIAMILTL